MEPSDSPGDDPSKVGGYEPPRETVEYWADLISGLRRARFDPKRFAEDMLVTEIVATCALSDIEADPEGVRSIVRGRLPIEPEPSSDEGGPPT